MKKIAIVVIAFLAMLGIIFYFGDNQSTGGGANQKKITDGKIIGEEKFGYVTMPGKWESLSDLKNPTSITYFNEENGSIIELASFADYKKSSSKEISGKGIQTVDDVVDFLHGYLKMIGRGENFKMEDGKFQQYDAKILKGGFRVELDGNKPYFLNAWVFSDDEGNLRYVIVESRLENSQTDMMNVINTYRTK